MNETTLYNAFAKISDTLTDTAYDAKKPARARVTGKLAAASLALVIVAAAAILVPAFSKAPVTETSGTEASAPNDENILYRSENGEFTIRKVEPLENPRYSASEWEEITDKMMVGANDVFLGTIVDVTEVFFDLGHTPDDLYIEGVGYLCDLSRYRSLITVEVKDIINGDLAKGDTVTFVFEVSSHNAEYTAGYRDIKPEKNKDYVFYLSKTSELANGFYFTPVADYIYHLIAPCMIPYDEPQMPELLEVIGAEEGTCGKAFVDSLKRYYGGGSGSFIYKLEYSDVTVRMVEPLDVPEKGLKFTWVPITEESLRGAAEVFAGTIENIDEIEITGEFMGTPFINYRSVLTVSVDEIVKGTGEIAEGDTVKLICSASTRFCSDGVSYPKEGKSYAFFLNKSSEVNETVDLSPIAEYTYDILERAFIPLDEPQFSCLLQLIGAEEGICGEEFVEALRRYYEEN